MADQKFVVIKDTNEKEGKGWNFTTGSSWCSGMVREHMDTGDYTFEGYHKLFTIERKADTSEVSMNVFEERFVRELERMEEIDYPFVVCEFSYQDVLDFPNNSGIPAFRWKYLKTTGNALLKRIMEFQVKYKAKWILTGEGNGQRVSSCIMKRMAEIINETRNRTTTSRPRANKK